MRGLLEYLQELIDLEMEFDVNQGLRYARRRGVDEDDWPEFEEGTLVEIAMANTVNKSGIYDWVRPLFHLDVDATKFVSYDPDEPYLCLYRVYLSQFVHTKEQFNELLSLYREPKIDIDAVFDVDGKRDRDRHVFGLENLEVEWEASPTPEPYDWEIKSYDWETESGRLGT